jgi:hypothetical protein
MMVEKRVCPLIRHGRIKKRKKKRRVFFFTSLSSCHRRAVPHSTLDQCRCFDLLKDREREGDEKGREGKRKRKCAAEIVDEGHTYDLFSVHTLNNSNNSTFAPSPYHTPFIHTATLFDDVQYRAHFFMHHWSHHL